MGKTTKNGSFSIAVKLPEGRTERDFSHGLELILLHTINDFSWPFAKTIKTDQTRVGN